MLRLLMAGVAVLAFAGQASAATRVFPVSATNAPPFRVLGATDTPQLGGPFLAGEDVLFVERTRGKLAVVSDGPEGRRDVATIADEFGAARAFAFDVAEGRVALTTWRGAQDFSLGTGPVEGPLHPLEGCGLTSVDAAADALAGTCAAGGYELHEEGAAPRRAERAEPVVVRVAGDFLAEGTPDGVRVLRRATGEEVYRVAAPLGAFDLGPDGAVAYAVRGAAQVGWASATDPADHRLAVPGPPIDVVADGDRIAVRLPVARGRRMLVLDRAGIAVADVTEPAPVAGFDLERDHLVWARQPCSRQSIVVWELAGPPPPSGGEDCTMPRIAKGTLRLRPDRSVSVPLACPARAEAGCAGAVALSILLRRGDGPLRLRAATSRPFDLLPGEQTTFRLRLSRRDVRRFTVARVEATLELLRRQQTRASRPLRLR